MFGMPSPLKTLALLLTVSWCLCSNRANAKESFPYPIDQQIQKTEFRKVKLKGVEKYVGQQIQTVMEVRSIRYSKSKVWCYLDSTKSSDDLKKSGYRNITLVFKAKGRKAFRLLGIDDPAKEYEGKRIRIKGKLLESSGKLQIEILEKKQIKVVGIRPKKN